ncbi:acyl-CoA synthetase [Mycobacterium sp. PS03-16]|uniref:AMP-binding protein n=1 Tax=Mycobacterium sp. PS03-16 TaxID=2559611 RepID=UPI001073FED9|nr:AMP-binding protein [Mycobacterium sp. PS03-16]TFV57405.1 acyl-CoA synthetase [Mycobacterium sp. PS03-16]
MSTSSLPGLLEERARRQPDDTAYVFLDYEVDPAGFVESLTWSQLHNRALVLAEELAIYGACGDRAAIIAPQGLDYIVAFFGALEAGLIAAPLSVPHFGVHDERISSVLKDCAPSVILTTSSVSAEVARYAEGAGRRAPAVVEVDSLDLDAPALPRQRNRYPRIAYLQYTSGSTRVPAGVVVTHENVLVNVDQAFRDYFGCSGSTPPGMSFVSWLPFYHDMGLIKGVCAPLVSGRRAVLMSPMAFLQRPARWMQQLAANPGAFSAAPNFAFELAARRTTDEDMAGLDLGGVLGICSGSERVHAATVRRFTERFAPFELSPAAVKPSYGLAEATVYVATTQRGAAPNIVRFDYEKLSSGHAMPCESAAAGGTDLLGHGTSRSTVMRIVDPETCTENSAGKVGEIWVNGRNVAQGYWQRPEETERVFGGRLSNPSAGTPTGPWLRTGDLGVISDGELFIIGRIKDLLIVDGSNHYPDDIEATVQEISNGRVAAISVPGDGAEHLVTIVEVKERGTAEERDERLRTLKRQITAAISTTHRVRVADLVFVGPGSIPITTSGKIRRSTCVERYRLDDFDRLDRRA